MNIGVGVAALALTLAATAAHAGDYRAPRTPSGAPNLEGLWTNASYTKLQRPKGLTSLVISRDAARAHEATLVKYHGVATPPTGDPVGQNDSEFPDSGDGLAVIRGQIRTSWIVAPVDGKIPYTAETKKRLHIGDATPPESFDNPEDRPQLERCLVSTGSSPPLLSAQDANIFQFVQTADHLVVVSEKNHDVRIIPIGGRRDPTAPRTWTGNAIGHWAADTLVVETDGFRGDLINRNAMAHSGDAHVVERFTRTAPGEVLYEFAVTDPKSFSQTWRGEMQFRATKGPLYEYACHEGNYSLPSILAAARQGHQQPDHAPTVVAAAAKAP